MSINLSEIDLARNIQQRAEDALSGIAREMTIMKWPPEIQTIMWGAVAREAMRRAEGN